MRHRVSGKQLNRNTTNRRGLFKSLMLALIEHGKIKTTQAKAKAVQGSFEKLMTKAKAGSVHERRLIDEVLNQRKAVNRLVDEIAPSVKRTSGYTRIVKLGNRRGDDALMVNLEIIDWKPKVAAVTAKPAKKTEASKKPAEEAKPVAAPAAAHQDEKTAKVKQPVTAKTQVKHIPQKRIAGGK